MSLALSAHATLTMPTGPVVLCIMDGVGLGAGDEDDAVASARTPHLDWLLSTCPHAALQAHGTAVGMPSDSDLGNSEVGHNAMGAGRVFDQGAKLVNVALQTGAAWKTEVWSRLTRARTLHLLGLFSNGNVHSHVDHLHAIIERAAQDGVLRLRVHLLTDGRDVPARSALTWARPLEDLLASMRDAGLDYRVASGGGRMHLTMDRYEANWAQVARGWATHVHGEGRAFGSLVEAIETLYAEDPETDDQWLPAFVIAGEHGDACGPIEDGDGVLFFNFRGDRAIEISRAFEEDDFTAFDRGRRPAVYYAGMLEYDGDAHIPSSYLVPPPSIDRTVGEHLAAHGVRTFAVSETQKFGHVTYFFNGNRSGYIDAELERYVEIPSDTLPFDQRPWMKAAEVADAAVEAVASGEWDHVRLNFANGDMVGHTGDLEATRIAVEAVDLQLGRLIRAVRDASGVLLVTADHGNADQMWLRKKGEVLTDHQGAPLACTAHTVNQVPFVVYDPTGRLDVSPSESSQLAQVGTTLVELCGLARPEGYLPGLVTLKS